MYIIKGELFDEKEKIMKFISIVLCLVFVQAMVVFAEPGEAVNDVMCQRRIVNDIEEYIQQLNEGVITPLETTITTFDSVAENEDSALMFGTRSWPWTDCSNVLGHSWGTWGTWDEVGERVHFSNGPYCIAHMQRVRFCQRTHCNVYEVEDDEVWVKCCNP